MRKNSSKREYRDYLIDIIETIESIEKFIKGFNLKKFKEDKKTTYAVVMAFEIIGEAAKNIPARIKNEHKEIPWKKMAGMRDKLVHEYFGANAEVIWKTVDKDIPELKKKILVLIESLKINKRIDKLI